MLGMKYVLRDMDVPFVCKITIGEYSRTTDLDVDCPWLKYINKKNAHYLIPMIVSGML